MSRKTEADVLRRLAVVVTRGTSNNLFQVATLVRAATALGASVDVLFRDDALTKLERNRINEPEWDPIYATVRAELHSRLTAADFSDMETFLRDAKQHGDDVRLWAEESSLQALGGQLERLTPLLDGACAAHDFARMVEAADAVLAF